MLLAYAFLAGLEAANLGAIGAAGEHIMAVQLTATVHLLDHPSIASAHAMLATSSHDMAALFADADGILLVFGDSMEPPIVLLNSNITHLLRSSHIELHKFLVGPSISYMSMSMELRIIKNIGPNLVFLKSGNKNQKNKPETKTRFAQGSIPIGPTFLFGPRALAYASICHRRRRRTS